MPNNIKITAGKIQIKAQLNDNLTAKSVFQALPIKAKAQRWGGEIYFEIPVTADLENDSRNILEPGELGFWPTGNAFCIFFGPTPASKADEIRAASDVNILGKITDDLSPLTTIPTGADVIIESA